LSFQAAYAAPFIMMSQNRQAAIDRAEAEGDFDVNRKAELEIELLHQKIDMLREQEIGELIRVNRALEERLAALTAGGGGSSARPCALPRSAPLFESARFAAEIRGSGAPWCIGFTEEVVARGHEVTLFGDRGQPDVGDAAADAAGGERFRPNFEYNNAPCARMIELVRREADRFDVLHFHIDFRRSRCSRGRRRRS
jgi:hypothetical protein